VVTLLLGALVIALVDRWRKRSRQDRPDTGDQLSHFRSLYDRGELSREEFEQIRAKLGAKLRQEMKISPKSDVPAKGEPPTPAAAAGPPARGAPGVRPQTAPPRRSVVGAGAA
jgi:hypothetical protein